MRTPLVSVCIPTRDRAAWLGEALASVFSQTLQDFEIVVCDDGSADATPELLGGCDDGRLRLVRHARPAGVAAARNSCLGVARGRYVAWLDADDRYLPSMLELQCAALERHPEAVMAHGGFHVIDGDGRRLPDWPSTFASDRVEPAEQAFAELSLRCYVSAPTVLVRRRAQAEAGAYRESLATAEDWEMWLRLCLGGALAYTAEPVAEYRWHPESLSRGADADGSRLSDELKALTGVLGRHRRRIPGGRATARKALSALAARAVRHANDRLTRGRRRAALASLGVALRARPGLTGRADLWRAVAAAATGDEYRWHLAARATLARLAEELEGTRAGEGWKRVAHPAPEWEAALREMADLVRRVVPADAAIAVIDKWDPTLLHLSRRRGWHFPDRSILADGYPVDSAAAVGHLERLRHLGAEYLVVPSSAYWWLDHYPGLEEYLGRHGLLAGADARCAIYRLGSSGSEMRWAA